MSAVQALNGHATTSHPAGPDSPDTVKATLTPESAPRVVENDEYAAFARRVLRAYARRVAAGDVEALTSLVAFSHEVETAIRAAVLGLRDFGYSWAEIAARVGITRQTAHERWAGDRR